MIFKYLFQIFNYFLSFPNILNISSSFQLMTTEKYFYISIRVATKFHDTEMNLNKLKLSKNKKKVQPSDPPEKTYFYIFPSLSLFMNIKTSTIIYKHNSYVLFVKKYFTNFQSILSYYIFHIINF